jgi:hypothetical protein
MQPTRRQKQRRAADAWAFGLHIKGLSVFQIKDRTFVVASAFLFAEIREVPQAQTMWGPRNEGIAWFLEVRTEENGANEPDGWEPSAECMCKFPKLYWQDIDGQVVEWGDSWDEEMGNPRGTLYLFNGCPIKNSRLTFRDRIKTEFHFRWEGLCDLFWNEDYRDNLELLIEGKAQFIGIAVYEKELSKAWQMLAQFQNPAEFSQDAIATYAGGSTTTFKPKVE